MENNNSLRFHLISIANFIAAFGGGLILGKGTGAIAIPLLKSGSILAFFIGGLLGLFFLQTIPSNKTASFARWLSICSSLCSFTLLAIFSAFAIHNKLFGLYGVLFFLLLSLRFGFWFYSRVLRASDAARHQQQAIAWVELGYYGGMILGLIVWKFIGLTIALNTALFIDGVMLLFAGGIDLYTIKSTTATIGQQENTATISHNDHRPHSETEWLWRLVISVVLLTIGTQAIIFYLAHRSADNMSAFVIAAFYLGTAFGALFCKRNRIELDWKNNTETTTSLSAIIYVKQHHIKKIINPLTLGCGMTIWVLTAILLKQFLQCSTLFNLTSIIMLSTIFIAAFFYEIFALALLERIGLEENLAHKSGMVIRAYGLMGIFSAIFLALLSVTHSGYTASIITLFISTTLASWLIYKRSPFSLWQVAETIPEKS